MRWGVYLVASLVACGTLRESDDAGDASGDTTTEACMAFDCADAWTFDSPPPPPPVLCPTTAPILNTLCTAPPGQDCEYGAKSYFCNQHFMCVAGEWKKNFSIDTFLCGTDEACSTVADGGPCQSQGQVCPNGDASVCVCTECGGGPPPDNLSPFWKCFSPGASCATDRANVGTACDLPDGSVCSYAPGSCCTGVLEQCTSGVWVGQQSEMCP